jgi:hypothetical protein
MGLLNYTTKIDPDKTAQEIAKCLSTHGASAVLTEYDPENNYVSAISFQIMVNDQKMGFRLPCDWKPVLRSLPKTRRTPHRYGNEQKKLHWEAQWRDQAVRTAWRIVKDWVEAQMALVETQMVTTAEVFLPYGVMKDGRTLARMRRAIRASSWETARPDSVGRTLEAGSRRILR